ncbi:MAG TPA: hypothetical protein VJY37_01510 [Anaerovoracaceae bacterium]|jgi:hypothetical protein|nr:hypothetical protein [Spirochaetia bacterium]HKM28340.1 hypothetical protein [Anaerovoracaceae bacterium]
MQKQVLLKTSGTTITAFDNEVLIENDELLNGGEVSSASLTFDEVEIFIQKFRDYHKNLKEMERNHVH